MRNDTRRKGIYAAAASALFLGVLPVFGKQAIIFGFSPLAVVTLRTGIAAFLLVIIMAIFKRQFFYIFPVGLAGCLLAGLVNGLGSIAYYTSLTRLDASVGQLIYSFYPLFLALWLLLDRQTISKMTVFRLLISVPGIYLLLAKGTHQVDLLGAGLMLIGTIMYALHLLINQRVLFEVPAPTVTLYTLISMATTVFVAYLLFDRSFPPATAAWWPIITMGTITFLSRLSLFLGVKNLGGMQTALLGLGELLVTVIFANLWLGERLTVMQWAGAGLIAISVVMVGFDKLTPDKRYNAGILSWLNPPKIEPTDLPWQS